MCNDGTCLALLAAGCLAVAGSLRSRLGSGNAPDREVVGFLPHPGVEGLFVEILMDRHRKAGLGAVVDHARRPSRRGGALSLSQRRSLQQEADAQVEVLRQLKVC